MRTIYFLDAHGLLRLANILEDHNHVIVYGIPRVGKTTLIYHFIKELAIDFRDVKYVIGSDLNEPSKFPKLVEEFKIKGNLLIIDNYEQIVDPDMLNLITNIWKSEKRLQTITVCRYFPKDKRFPNEPFPFHLNEFTTEHCKLLLFLFLKEGKSSENKISEISSLLPYIPKTPEAIRDLASYAKRCKNFSTIYNIISNEINYANKVFTEKRVELILPEQRKVLENAQLLERSLTRRIQQNIKAIFKFTPYRFKRFVIELYEHIGFEVIANDSTNTTEKQLILFQNNSVGKTLYYVTFRNYTNKKVAVNVIKQIKGAVLPDKVKITIKVATSRFKLPEFSRVKQIEIGIPLADFFRLNKFLKKLT